MIKIEFVNCFKDYDWILISNMLDLSIQHQLNWNERQREYIENHPCEWEFISQWLYNDHNLYNKESIDLIKCFPNKPWDWSRLSYIYFADLIICFPDKPWNWESIHVMLDDPLSMEMEFKLFDLVISFPDKPWDWEYISQFGPYCYFDFIISRLDLPWNWDYITHSDERKEQFSSSKNILSYPDLPWNWKELSKPRYFKYEILENFPNKDWDWKELSKSPKIPINFVTSNKDKDWDGDEISKNADMLQNLSIKIVAKSKIVEQFRKSMSNPKYKLCRSRLLKEFKALERKKPLG